jgi:hypothetical protein
MHLCYLLSIDEALHLAASFAEMHFLIGKAEHLSGQQVFTQLNAYHTIAHADNIWSALPLAFLRRCGAAFFRFFPQQLHGY